MGIKLGAQLQQSVHPETGQKGLLVQSVSDSGLAVLNGLRAGDFVIRFQNLQVASLSAFDAVAETVPQGSPISFNVIRGSQEVTLGTDTAVAGAAPSEIQLAAIAADGSLSAGNLERLIKLQLESNKQLEKLNSKVGSLWWSAIGIGLILLVAFYLNGVKVNPKSGF